MSQTPQIPLQQRLKAILEGTTPKSAPKPLTTEITAHLKEQISKLPIANQKIAKKRRDHIYHCIRYIAQHYNFETRTIVQETLNNCDFANPKFRLNFKAIAATIQSNQ